MNPPAIIEWLEGGSYNGGLESNLFFICHSFTNLLHGTCLMWFIFFVIFMSYFTDTTLRYVTLQYFSEGFQKKKQFMNFNLKL